MGVIQQYLSFLVDVGRSVSVSGESAMPCPVDFDAASVAGVTARSEWDSAL
jgi:hypothetical protein